MKAFLESDEGKIFLSECKKYSIDVELYEGLGISSIIPFGAWINGDFMQKLGEDDTRKIIRESGEALKNE